jgi:hypothetical protein
LDLIQDRADPLALLLGHARTSLLPVLDKRYHVTALNLARGELRSHLSDFGQRGAPTSDGLAAKRLESDELVVREFEPVTHLHDRFDTLASHARAVAAPVLLC